MYDTNQVSGIVLPFHCYSEPNGDVVFTKNKRTKGDYDGNGSSMVTEKEVLSRTADAPSNSSRKRGCLGIIIAGLVVVSIIAFV